MTEWDARDYSKQSSLQKAMADQVLARLKLKGAERVLDVGCGDGKITAAIAERVPRGSVLGTDPSRDMIAFASKQFGPPAHANLRFEVADVRSMPYQNEFDLVVSFNALHWVPEQEAALHAIRRALKPTGGARLRMVPEGQRKCLEDVIEEVRKLPPWAASFEGFQKPYAHFTADAYRAMAEKCGFRVLEVRVESGAWDFGSREAFEAFARATFVEWTRRLPESQWPAFITDVLDRYRLVAADGQQDLNTFKYYQMDVELAAV